MGELKCLNWRAKIKKLKIVQSIQLWNMKIDLVTWSERVEAKEILVSSVKD